jgi:hypothetical protein
MKLLPHPFGKEMLMSKHLAVIALLLGSGVVSAAEPERKPVGKLVSEEGTVFQQSNPGEAWQIVKAKGSVYAGDLLLGLPGAVLENTKGTVRLTLLTDFDKNSPYPILEAAVTLHENPDLDLQFTLDRGRVDVTNIKDKGATKVGINFHKEKWRATLEEPGTRIALELYGRWPKGTHFKTDPGPEDVPSADLLLLVRKGHIELLHCDIHPMSAPPGPALLHWDNSEQHCEAPQRLDKLPDWAATEQSTSERAEQIRKRVETVRREALKTSPRDAVRKLVESEDPDERATAVITMGAMDDREGLSSVLSSTRYPDTWDRAVVVIRHGLGRGPGRDQELYRYLVDQRGIKPAHAATILQLLHSPGDEELEQPELYRMLVRFLDHDRLGIRGLAHWHLSRLVPAGNKFGYNPLAAKDERDKAQAQWKKLVEDMLAKGELPPKSPIPK